MGGHMQKQQDRLATFDLSAADGDDDLALERAWNTFVAGLASQGLRPADEPHQYTETSATYRVFEVELVEPEYTLDFDMKKIVALAVGFVSTGALSWVADFVTGLADAVPA